MHDIKWFLDHLENGKTIKRIAKDIITGKERISYQRVESKDQAEYLFGLQSDHISFEENEPRSHGYKKDKVEDPFESDEPVIRIHKLDMDLGCESCSS